MGNALLECTKQNEENYIITQSLYFLNVFDRNLLISLAIYGIIAPETVKIIHKHSKLTVKRRKICLQKKDIQ